MLLRIAGLPAGVDSPSAVSATLGVLGAGLLAFSPSERTATGAPGEGDGDVPPAVPSAGAPAMACGAGAAARGGGPQQPPCGANDALPANSLRDFRRGCQRIPEGFSGAVENYGEIPSPFRNTPTATAWEKTLRDLLYILLLNF